MGNEPLIPLERPTPGTVKKRKKKPTDQQCKKSQKEVKKGVRGKKEREKNTATETEFQNKKRTRKKIVANFTVIHLKAALVGRSVGAPKYWRELAGESF